MTSSSADRLARERQHLIERALRVAHAALGGARDERQRASPTSIFSAAAIMRSCSTMAFVGIVRNSNTCERDRMVSGILCSSVVAIMKTTWAGGSSIDFSSALNEGVESWCTSSMMNTL